MSKRSRTKGKVGERKARDLLTSRDWCIIANTADGSECEDLVVKCPKGIIYSVEVKNRKIISYAEVRKQAATNAAKSGLPWMLMCKIEGTDSWLIGRKNHKPTVWSEK